MTATSADRAAVRAVLRTRQLLWHSGPAWRGRCWALRRLFEPRDLWIGVYWTRKKISGGLGRRGMRTDLYICLLPCLPLHLELYSRDWEPW